jgi:hypothetical protein
MILIGRKEKLDTVSALSIDKKISKRERERSWQEVGARGPFRFLGRSAIRLYDVPLTVSQTKSQDRARTLHKHRIVTLTTHSRVANSQGLVQSSPRFRPHSPIRGMGRFGRASFSRIPICHRRRISTLPRWGKDKQLYVKVVVTIGYSPRGLVSSSGPVGCTLM